MNKKEKVIQTLKSIFFSFVWLGVLLFGLDLLSKLLIENLYTHDIDILGIFNITLVYNEGMAFGIGANGETWVRWVLMLVSLVMSIAFIFYFIKTYKTSTKTQKAFLMLIIAGAVGNLVDRFFFVLGVPPYHRGVIDWIGFAFWPGFAIFNLADAYLVVGLIAFIIYMLVTSIMSNRKAKLAGSVEEETTHKVLSKDEQERFDERNKKDQQDK